MGLWKSIKQLRELTGQAKQVQEQQQAAAGYEPGMRGMFSQMSDLVDVATDQLSDLSTLGQDEQRILATGIDAEGVIVNMGTPARGAARFNIDLDIEVRVPGQAAYRVANQYIVPASPALHPGAVLPIKVDPEDPAKIAIDWNRVAAPPARGEVRPVAPGGDDIVAQLEKLQALRASGAITDDEFARLKAQLL